MGRDKHIEDMFRQESFADADVSIVFASPGNQDAQSAEDEPEELDRFPGHLIVLTKSPYFQCKVNFARLQVEQRGRGRNRSPDRSAADTGAGPARSRSRSSTRKPESSQTDRTGTPSLQRSAHTSSDSPSVRPTVVVPVEDRAHAPAAIAVIARLYGVKREMERLPQHELVYVLQYADMLQVQWVALKAVALLQAATTKRKLTTATMAAIAAMPTLPSYMLSLVTLLGRQVTAMETATTVADAKAAVEGAATLSRKNASIQQVLVAAFGNLETVWQQKELTKLLLELPLAAMQLLLLSDQLQVYSEDTVLYTVEQYIAQQEGTETAARTQLSGLIRAPHLSDLQLSMQTFQSGIAPYLGVYRRESHQELQQLQQLRGAGATSQEMEKIVAEWSNVPSSWLKGPRQELGLPVDGVSLTWQLHVSDLKALVADCTDTKQMQILFCTQNSPPLKGIHWQMWASCYWDDDGNSVHFGAAGTPFDEPSGFYSKFKFSWQWPGGILGPINSQALDAGAFAGPDLGVLANGWDEAAWVAQGLPCNGFIELKLTLYDVW